MREWWQCLPQCVSVSIRLDFAQDKQVGAHVEQVVGLPSVLLLSRQQTRLDQAGEQVADGAGGAADDLGKCRTVGAEGRQHFDSAQCRYGDWALFELPGVQYQDGM